MRSRQPCLDEMDACLGTRKWRWDEQAPGGRWIRADTPPNPTVRCRAAVQNARPRSDALEIKARYVRYLLVYWIPRFCIVVFVDVEFLGLAQTHTGNKE